MNQPIEDLLDGWRERERHRLFDALNQTPEGTAVTYERIPGDERTVVVLDVSAPGRWRWRAYAAGWLLVAALAVGVAVGMVLGMVTA